MNTLRITQVLCFFVSIIQGFPPTVTKLPYIIRGLLFAYRVWFAGITAMYQAAEVLSKGCIGLVSNRIQGTLIRRPSVALFSRRQ